LIYRKVRTRHSYRFGLGFWCFMLVGLVSVYMLFAILKNELLPSHLNFDLNNPPADHVALLYTIWYQLHRSQGSIFDTHSLVWHIRLARGCPKIASFWRQALSPRRSTSTLACVVVVTTQAR